MHTPINHHLRPMYRTLSALSGAYLLGYGIVGLVQTRGVPAFSRDQAEWVLGLRTNPAFATFCIVLGAALVLGQLVGRNVGHYVNLGTSVVLMVVGTAGMAFMQTDANVLALSMVNVIVLYSLAIVLGTAGLYDKTGTSESAADEEALRRG